MARQDPTGSGHDREVEQIEMAKLELHVEGICDGYPKCLSCVIEDTEWRNREAANLLFPQPTTELDQLKVLDWAFDRIIGKR
jgi:hypothetical protein